MTIKYLTIFLLIIHNFVKYKFEDYLWLHLTFTKLYLQSLSFHFLLLLFNNVGVLVDNFSGKKQLFDVVERRLDEKSH
jgi:hypothetical protein